VPQIFLVSWNNTSNRYWVYSDELINVAGTQWYIGPQKSSGGLINMCSYWAIEIFIGLISMWKHKNIGSWITLMSWSILLNTKDIKPLRFSGELFNMCFYWAIDISIGFISIVDHGNIESREYVNTRRVCINKPLSSSMNIEYR